MRNASPNAKADQQKAILLVAQRQSTQREARDAQTINQQFARCGVHVISVLVDDRSPESLVAHINIVEDAGMTAEVTSCAVAADSDWGAPT